MTARPGRAVAALVVVVALAASACSSAEGTAGDDSWPSGRYGVGLRTLTVTNDTPLVGRARRTLETSIYYPTARVRGATPRREARPAAGPFPLVVYAHGLGGVASPAGRLVLTWVRAGYVVAAPRFPHTSIDAPGGVDPGDFVNQPGDVTAVIDAVLATRDDPGDPLAGVVADAPVGVAGHSLGGITTLGLAANSCCADDRIGAAIALAGDPLVFPGGRFDYRDAPPLLLVHGADDALVPYEGSVDAFNRARGPKGMLTIRHGDHGAPVANGGTAAAAVARTTVAFFDAYLQDDAGARARLPTIGRSPATRYVFVTDPGASTTIPTRPRPVRHLQATVTPDAGLVDGQTVTVTWRGFTPGKTINIVQCSGRTPGDSTACDLRNGHVLTPDPTGAGSLPLAIVVGPVGDGICDADHQECEIVVNDGGSLDPDASVRIPITFARP